MNSTNAYYVLDCFVSCMYFLELLLSFPGCQVTKLYIKKDNFGNCNQTPLNSSRISLPKDNKHCTGGGCAAVFLFRQRPSSLCWVFPAGPDNAPWRDLCSAEPDTAVATLRTHRTEVDPFRCSPPPLHLHIASFPARLCPSLRSFFL